MDGSTLPSEVIFNNLTNTFTVFTSDVTLDAVYQIKVTVKLLDILGQNTTSFNWNLTIQSNYDYCSYYLIWTSTPSILSQSYEAGGSPLYVPFSTNDLTWTPLNCTSRISCTATLANGTALPSYISLNASTTTFAVYTSDPSVSGNLTISVTCSLVDWIVVKSRSFTWDLTIISTKPEEKYVVSNNIAPHFMVPPPAVI